METQLSLSKGGTAAFQFLAHVCCSQTAGWIKMSHDTEVGSAQATLCLMGTQLLPERGTAASTFWSMSVVAKRLDGSGYHLIRR